MASIGRDERESMVVVRVKREIRFDAARSRFPIAEVVTVGIAEDQPVSAFEIGTDINIEPTFCRVDPNFERA